MKVPRMAWNRWQAGKPFEPTETQRITVAAMAACGMPQDMICSKIENPQTGKAVDIKTRRAAFRDELKEAKALATARWRRTCSSMPWARTTRR